MYKFEVGKKYEGIVFPEGSGSDKKPVSVVIEVTGRTAKMISVKLVTYKKEVAWFFIPGNTLAATAKNRKNNVDRKFNVALGPAWIDGVLTDDIEKTETWDFDLSALTAARPRLPAGRCRRTGQAGDRQVYGQPI